MGEGDFPWELAGDWVLGPVLRTTHVTLRELPSAVAITDDYGHRAFEPHMSILLQLPRLEV